MRTRAKMLSILGSTYPSLTIHEDMWVDGPDMAIVMSAEDGTTDRNGIPLFDYWELASSEEVYTFGVVNHLNRWAERAGWYFEWINPGTMCLRPA